MFLPRSLPALLLLAMLPLFPSHAGEPYIVLTGDSTVTDEVGWGRAFAALLKPGIACTNLARGGASSKSFRAIGRWDEAMSLGPTIVLIQFGHNDMPGKGPERETDPETTFHDNLTHFVEEARAVGAQPILVTSIPRRVFTGPHLVGELAPYAAATRRVAAEQHVPVADLYARSIPVLEALGHEACDELGPRDKDGKPDRTHLAEKGAALTAELLASELRRIAPDAAALLRDDAGRVK